MIATATWKEDQVFEGRSEAGHTITFDGDSAHTHGAFADGSRPSGALFLHLRSISSPSSKRSANPSPASPSPQPPNKPPPHPESSPKSS